MALLRAVLLGVPLLLLLVAAGVVLLRGRVAGLGGLDEPYPAAAGLVGWPGDPSGTGGPGTGVTGRDGTDDVADHDVRAGLEGGDVVGLATPYGTLPGRVRPVDPADEAPATPPSD